MPASENYVNLCESRTYVDTNTHHPQELRIQLLKEAFAEGPWTQLPYQRFGRIRYQIRLGLDLRSNHTSHWSNKVSESRKTIEMITHGAFVSSLWVVEGVHVESIMWYLPLQISLLCQNFPKLTGVRRPRKTTRHTYNDRRIRNWTDSRHFIGIRI